MPGFRLTFGTIPTPLMPIATIMVIPTATTNTLNPPYPTPTLTSTELASQGLDRVKIYLIAIGTSTGVLRAALKELFKLEGQQYYGQSGLYNALYQSELDIADVAVVGGEARIFLTGTVKLGGECDTPRVEAQLKTLALQFSTVERVSIYINGKPQADVLSLKG